MQVEDMRMNRLARSAALALLALAGALLIGGGAGAQDSSPVGGWQTIDDETKQPMALVRISEEGGVLNGRIEKLFNPSRPDPVCEHAPRYGSAKSDRGDRAIS